MYNFWILIVFLVFASFCNAMPLTSENKFSLQSRRNERQIKDANVSTITTQGTRQTAVPIYNGAAYPLGIQTGFQSGFPNLLSPALPNLLPTDLSAGYQQGLQPPQIQPAYQAGFQPGFQLGFQPGPQPSLQPSFQPGFQQGLNPAYNPSYAPANLYSQASFYGAFGPNEPTYVDAQQLNNIINLANQPGLTPQPLPPNFPVNNFNAGFPQNLLG